MGGSKVQKKRKIGTDSVEGSTAQKKKKEDDFSVVHFKFMIKDSSTSFAALEKFHEEAEKYPDVTNVDIIANYCRSSPECIEVFQLLEMGKRKPAEVYLIFKTLEMILMRIADDLSKLKPVAQSIIHRIMASHMGLLYVTLAMKNKSTHIKEVLKLLIAMVMQGENEARDVQLQFNFSHNNIYPLLRRTDTKDKQDVRMCVIQFMMSFLMVGDAYVIKQLTASKFLHLLFPGIEHDKVMTVEMVLSTLTEKVVKNPSLNKTARIQLFNEKNLKHLVSLYKWKGPKAWQKKSAGSRSTHQTPEVDTDPEKQEYVKNLIHQFLMELCCSITNGINFLDKTFATGKNMNHVLTNMLKCLHQPYMCPLQSELIINILQVCPDQLHWYLPSLKHVLEPRTTRTWLNCIHLVKQVYKAQKETSPALLVKEAVPPSKLSTMVMNTLFPPREVWAELLMAVKSSERLVQYEGLKLMLVVMKRVNLTLSNCTDNPAENSPQMKEFINYLTESIRKELPNVGNWMSIWKSMMDEIGSPMKKENVTNTPTDIPQMKAIDIAVPLLQCICNYQQVIPTDLQSQAIDYAAILHSVQILTVKLTEGRDFSGVTEELDVSMVTEGRDVSMVTEGRDVSMLTKGRDVSVVTEGRDVSMVTEERDVSMVTEGRDVSMVTKGRDVSQLWLCVLQLLSHTEDVGIQWNKVTDDGKTFVYTLLEAIILTKGDEQLNRQVKGLIVKMLTNTGIFGSSSSELYLWLDGLCQTDINLQQDRLKFMEQVFLMLLKDPYTYTERVMEFTSEAAALESNPSLDTLSVTTTTDAIVDMVLSMEPVSLDNGQTDDCDVTESHDVTSSSDLFTPLVPCVLELMSSSSPGGSTETIVPFVCDVLQHVLRCQSVPTAVCLLLYKYRETLNGQQILNIVKHFLPEEMQVELTGLEINVTPKLKSKKKKKESLGKTEINKTVGDKLESVFVQSLSEGVLSDLCADIQSNLCHIDVQEYPNITRQCLQYIAWYSDHKQRVELGNKVTDLYVNIVVNIVCMLTTGKPQTVGSDDNIQLTESSVVKDIAETKIEGHEDTTENLKQRDVILIEVVSIILKHPCMLQLLVEDHFKDKGKTKVKLESQKVKLKAASTKEKLLKCSELLRTIMDLLPERLFGCVVNTCNPYVNIISEHLSKQHKKDHMNYGMLNIMMAFWKLLNQGNTVEAAERLINHWCLTLKSGNIQDDMNCKPILMVMLEKIEKGRFELHGNKFSKNGIAKLVALATTDSMYESLVDFIYNMFSRYPAYCLFINENIFKLVLEHGAFGAAVSKKLSVVKVTVEKTLANNNKKSDLLNVVAVWIKYSAECRDMFEKWVKATADVFSVDGCDICTVITQYFVHSRKQDTTVKSLLSRHYCHKIEEYFTMETHDKDTTMVGDIDEMIGVEVLEKLNKDDANSLLQKFEKLIKVGSKHMTLNHVTMYKRLIDVVSDKEDRPVYTQRVNSCIEGLVKYLERKNVSSKGMIEALIELVREHLLHLSGDTELVSQLDVLENSSQLQGLLKLGLKQFYGAALFQLMECIVVLLIKEQDNDSSYESDGKGIEIDSDNDNESEDNESETSESFENESMEESETGEESSIADDVNSNSNNNNKISQAIESSEEESSQEANMESESETDEGNESSMEDDDDDQSIGNESDKTGEVINETVSGKKRVIESSSEDRHDNAKMCDVEIDEETGRVLMSLYQMLLSHSQFLPTILDEEKKATKDKECLLDLMIATVSRYPSVCDPAHLAVLFGAYSATMVTADQKLLYLIHLYETKGTKLTQYRPYLWGASAIQHYLLLFVRPYLWGASAIQHYSVRKSLSDSLWKMPLTSQVIDNINTDKLWNSVVNLPLRRTLIPSNQIYSCNEDLKEHEEIYDPCFILPVLFHLLSPENAINCNKFVEHKCLSYVIAALSCHDDHMRGLAYSILARFYHHLEGARFSEKKQLLNLLDCVKNSVDRVNMKLACIVTVFLAKVTLLMLTPGERMYQILNAFILLKPNIDVLNVPEFYKLFNSSALEYKTERSWMLNLLVDGLRDTADYRIFGKRFTFKLLLSFYNSALSDLHTQKQVLKVVSKACSIKTATFDLAKNHGILTWMVGLVKDRSSDSDVTSLLVDIAYNLWFTMLDNRDTVNYISRKNPVLPLGFTHEMITVLVTYLRYISSFHSPQCYYRFMRVLESALEHEERSRYYHVEVDNTSHPEINLTLTDALYILKHWTAPEIFSQDSLHVIAKDLLMLYTSNNTVQMGSDDKSNTGITNHDSKNTTSVDLLYHDDTIAFPVISADDYHKLLVDNGTKQPVECMVDVLTRVTPPPCSWSTNGNILAGYLYVVHCGLQLGLMMNKVNQNKVQKLLDWIQSVFDGCENFDNFLLNSKNSSVVTVREMITLLKWRIN